MAQVVRVLEELDVNPQKLIAAGRSYHVPLVENDTAENRAKNRRTRIIVLPKIDESLKRIEEGSYGYCEATGEPIGIERLLVRPTAIFCAEEKNRQEKN